MPQFDPARLDPASYPYSTSVETRFQDLDPLGHINNVAMAALFENGRVRFNRDNLVERQRRVPGDRWLIARVEINYLAEGHFPDPIEVASGIGTIGNRSWTILSAAWQSGRCVGLCDSTIVYQSKDGKQPISDDFRAELERWKFGG
ncbi:acyl-CoA thioesterase [Sphingopyxis sp. XHP0097]|jgi:acyl-CoA thioester hydrolase|uniref:Acyl-CoA thioesterase n=1 Tax=Sphingopyxis jiangsuensis TaxID=2871171 RepID=A0ABS7MHY8_9SPHN|nr:MULTISPECIES: acyl-CoA thioesterase [Sphingopyxis]MBY4637696.1 acyl-CoA thioesterase [Sphingopyxis jiangsuensis]